MDAGRELDALVAERVMGWVDIEDFSESGSNWAGVPPEARVPDAHGRTVSWYASPFEILPNYSTDIAAAWLVVDMLKQYGPVIEYYSELGHFWRALFTDFPPTDGRMSVLADAPTAPHAICLAALKAVGAPYYDASAGE